MVCLLDSLLAGPHPHSRSLAGAASLPSGPSLGPQALFTHL
jgi:hypothetical protein